MTFGSLLFLLLINHYTKIFYTYEQLNINNITLWEIFCAYYFGQIDARTSEWQVVFKNWLEKNFFF